MSNVTVPSSPLRIDVSRVTEYAGPEKAKVSFGKKVGQFLGKALGVLGPIGAAVMSATGVGILPAAALYGVSNFAGNAAATSVMKDQAAASQQARAPLTMPGLFEQPSSVSTQPNFVIPSDLEKPVNTTLQNSELARSQAVEGFQFY